MPQLRVRISKREAFCSEKMSHGITIIEDERSSDTDKILDEEEAGMEKEFLIPPQNRSRRGSTTLGPPKRDLMLEHKIAKWILSLDGGEAGDNKHPGDFGGWLEDGSVLAGSDNPFIMISIILSAEAEF